ncbi:MAG: hypothetical protein ACM35E_07915, partial [Deltaproteobacteria bacterium]
VAAAVVLAAARLVTVAAVLDAAAEVLVAVRPAKMAAVLDVDDPAVALPVKASVPPAAPPVAVFAAGLAVAAEAFSPSPVRFAAPAPQRKSHRAARRARNRTRGQRRLSPPKTNLLRSTSDPNFGWYTEVQKHEVL